MTRTDKKAATRAALMAAAITVFETVGYEQATMRQIARAAGLSTGAIFANWKGKEDLYREVMGRAPMTAEWGETLREAALGVLDTLFDDGHGQVFVMKDLGRAHTAAVRNLRQVIKGGAAA